MVYFKLLTAFALALSGLAATDSPPSLSSPLGPVVNLGYAAFAGNTTSPTGTTPGPVTFFGGIPYAEPPMGNLRFRAPVQLNEKVQSDAGPSVTDARNWGPPCIQQPAQVGVGSEGLTSYLIESNGLIAQRPRLLDLGHLEADKCEGRR